MTRPRFAVGDRVTRRVDVFDEGSRLRRGMVTERYQNRNRYGFYPELYVVRWDDTGLEERGYLPHGLTPEIWRAQDTPK